MNRFGCGIASPELNLTNRIVNGENAVRGKLSWHASLINGRKCMNLKYALGIKIKMLAL